MATSPDVSKVSFEPVHLSSSDEANDSNSSFIVTANVSSTAADNDSEKDGLGQMVVVLVQCLIIVFTLVGNGLVVGAVASTYRLRSVTNYYVASLAVADLTVAVLVMPFSVMHDYWGKWIFGWVFCYFWISCDVMCCTASILHLCVISIDRYLAIDEPLTYASHLSSRRPGLVIVGIWACSAAISFVPVYAGWFADDTVELHRDSDKCGLFVNKTYAIISSTTSFYLPLFVMLVVYAKIFCIARHQSKEIVRLEKSLDRNGVRNRGKNCLHVRHFGRHNKAIKTLGTLMGLFCVSWLPFFIVYVVKPFCTHCYFPEYLMMTINWLGYCNSFFNPCVYGLINKDFLHAYKRLLLCKRPRNFQVDQQNAISLTIDAGREQNPLTSSLMNSGNGRNQRSGNGRSKRILVRPKEHESCADH